MPLRSRQPPNNPVRFASPAIRAGIRKPRFVSELAPTGAFIPPTSTRGPRVLQRSGQGQAPQGAGKPTGPGCEGRSAPDKGVCAASGRVKKSHEIGLKLQGQPSAPAPAPSSSGPPGQRAPVFLAGPRPQALPLPGLPPSPLPSSPPPGADAAPTHA